MHHYQVEDPCGSLGYCLGSSHLCAAAAAPRDLRLRHARQLARSTLSPTPEHFLRYDYCATDVSPLPSHRTACFHVTPHIIISSSSTVACNYTAELSRLPDHPPQSPAVPAGAAALPCLPRAPAAAAPPPAAPTPPPVV